MTKNSIGVTKLIFFNEREALKMRLEQLEDSEKKKS